MPDEEQRRKWEELYDEWGKQLLRQFPQGLGSRPDFSRDGLARTEWVTEALKVYVPLGAVYNLMPLNVPGGKSYPNFTKLSVAEECEIANATFTDAELRRTLAGYAEERRAAEERKRAEALRADDERVASFISRASSIDSSVQLNFERDRLITAIDTAVRQHDEHDAGVLRRELLVVQDRMLAIERNSVADERRKSARDRRLGLWGIIVGIAFGVVSILIALAIARWPHDFEAPETHAPSSHVQSQGDQQPAPPAPAQIAKPSPPPPAPK